MGPTRRLDIARHIHRLLRLEIGEGISVTRMLNEPLYARDVLLVCDALPDHGLAELAQRFRAASAPPGAPGASRKKGPP